MGFYDLSDEQARAMNVDADFYYCLEYNPQPFNFFDVERVLAVIEGENEERDWHWVVLLRDGRKLYLRGGCDYTGWDCQSDADTIFLDDNVSLADAIGQLYKDWIDEDTNIFLSELQRQLGEGKDETWRERKDREFGLRSEN